MTIAPFLLLLAIFLAIFGEGTAWEFGCRLLALLLAIASVAAACIRGGL